MNIVVEILLELLLEGSIECIRNPKTPLSLRVTAIVLLTLFGATYILLFLHWTISLWKDGNIASAVIVGAIGVGLPTLLLWGIRKKYKSKH